MSYHLMDYYVVFLPFVLLGYQLVPQRFRPVVLLAANYVFFYLLSGELLVYLLFSTIFAHYIGIWLENVELTTESSVKQVTKKKRQVLAFGIIVSLGILGILKYFNFFAQTVVGAVGTMIPEMTFTPVKFMIPIGISFYTLQIISYITDVDVYDMAEWCALAELGAISMDNNCAAVTFPDFTRGHWDEVKGYKHAYATPEQEAAQEAYADAYTAAQKEVTAKLGLWTLYDAAKKAEGKAKASAEKKYAKAAAKLDAQIENILKAKK